MWAPIANMDEMYCQKSIGHQISECVLPCTFELKSVIQKILKS